jgi:hypothetical protein
MKMPLFPKIQSTCPYKSDIAAIMDGDMCRMCKRQVFDITAMSDGDRVAFLAGCEEEVCVSYSIGPALRAAALAAAIALPTAAAAQEEMVIIVGGITAPSSVKMVHVPDDVSIPELPVLYEEEEPAPAQPEAAAKSSAQKPRQD